MAESEKTMKIGFRPWPMSKKQQKQSFGRGRKLQNGKHCVSATADELKTEKADFRPRPKAHCLPTLTHGREKYQPWNCLRKLQLSFHKDSTHIFKEIVQIKWEIFVYVRKKCEYCN